ncbi:MAG: AI-2E family transporter [Acidimicrobiaceae bacterium]|nr:AI-2E family transporter [Acidimicrobiaceae bacterium]
MSDGSGGSDRDSSGLKRAFQIQLMALSIGLSLWLVWFLRSLVLDVLLALIVALVLDPAVKFLYRFNLKRSIASVIVFVAALCIFLVVVFLVTRPLYNAGVKFSHELPRLVNQAQTGTGRFGQLIRQFHVDSYVQANSSKLTSLLTQASGPAVVAAKTVLSGVARVVTIFLLSLFIEIEAPVLFGVIYQQAGPLRRVALMRVRRRLVKAITGYVLGNLLTSIIAGVVVYIALLALGVPFPIVLAVWVAVVDLLPLVGGLLAGVPTVLFALLHSVAAGIIVAVIFIVYQQLENHILNPVIMSRTVRLNTLWVLISVLVGADLLGFIGALIGIPVAATIQVIGGEIWSMQQRKRGIDPAEGQLFFDDKGGDLQL